MDQPDGPQVDETTGGLFGRAFFPPAEPTGRPPLLRRLLFVLGLMVTIGVALVVNLQNAQPLAVRLGVPIGMTFLAWMGWFVRNLLERSERSRLEVERRAVTTLARHNAVLGSALDCIIVADHEGRILEFNPAAETTFGYARSDVLGKSLSETVIPPSFREAHRRGLVRFITSGEARVLGRRIEFTAMRSDGSEFPAELAINLSREEGTPVFTAYLRDITQRKLEEEKLMEARSRYRNLVESLPAVVYTARFGADGDWLYVSPQIESILGFSPNEWLANPGLWFEHIHPDDRAQVLQDELKSQVLDEELASEYRMLHRDGHVVWFRDIGTVIRDESDRPVLLQGVMLEITEEKQLEEQLQQSQKMGAVGERAESRRDLGGPDPVLEMPSDFIRGRILLVDDKEGVRKLVRKVLTGGGYEVVEAPSGRLALEILLGDLAGFDLLLTNVVMPLMSGTELARRVRELRDDIKVMYMSGYTDNVIADDGEFMEGEIFIHKPFRAERLLAKVAEALGSQAAA